MEKEAVVIENPVVVAGLTLVPVVRVVTHYWQAKGGRSLLSVKQPVAVILISPAGKRVLRVTGEESSMDELIQEAPDIKEMLAKIG